MSMLWVSLHLPHLALELRHPSESEPLAVAEGVGKRRCMIACNRAALSSGITLGMDAPSSMMRQPALRILERSRPDERREMTALASWAHQFTSQVSFDASRWMIWLEVGSSLRYFDGLASIYGRIRSGMEQLGYTASLGVAPTLEAAALLTQHPELMPLINRSALRSIIAGLPLEGLALGTKVIDQLHTAGL